MGRTSSSIDGQRPKPMPILNPKLIAPAATTTTTTTTATTTSAYDAHTVRQLAGQ